MSNDVILSTIKRDYIYRLAEQNKRVDGRDFNEYRKISIETNLIRKAEGSARVKLGNTQVLVGVKLEVGEPYPDSPDKGVLTTSAELIPLASPDFEAGPPDKDAIELARVVDRGIRESNVIDLEKLCIEPGEKVWIVFVDIHVLDYDGNLFDASSWASLAALCTAIVPAERFGLGENFPLPVNYEMPVSCTFAKFNKAIVLDPCLEEELIAEARLTVTTDKNGDIRAMQKGLGGSFTIDEVKKIIKTSIVKGAEVRKIIERGIKHGKAN